MHRIKATVIASWLVFKISDFGESHIEAVAEKFEIAAFTRIPIDPKLAKACDEGEIEKVDAVWMKELIGKIRKI